MRGIHPVGVLLGGLVATALLVLLDNQIGHQLVLLGLGGACSIILAGVHASGARRTRGGIVELLFPDSSETPPGEDANRLALDALRCSLWEWDVTTGQVTRSAGLQQLLGYAPGEIAPSPQAWLDLMHPDDREPFMQQLAAATQTGGSVRMQYRMKHRDARFIDILDQAVVVTGPDGARRVVGCAQDVTELRLNREAVVESEEAYRRLFDLNPVAMIVFDPADGAMVKANDAAVAFYGYPRKRLESLNIFDLCSKGRGGDHSDLDGKLDSTPHLTSCHRLASGEVRDVEIFSTAMQQRGRRLVCALVIDITERKRVEAQLQESRRMLEQAQAVGRIGTWVSDASPDGKLLWSSQVFRIFGVSPDAFDQQISTFFRLVHPDDVDEVRRCVARAIQDRSIYRIDHRIIRPDGEVRWVLEQGEVECEADGSPRRVIGVVQDITERREAELAIKDTARRYQQLFDSNPEPLWVYDTSTLRFVAVNLAAVEAYGYSREEFLAMTILEIRPPDERARLEHYLAAVPQNRRTRGTWVHRTRDGRVIDVEIISHPIEFEGQSARIVLAKDITERLAAERALQHSERNLRDAQRIGEFGDWEYNLGTRVFQWSEQVYRLFRRDPALGPPTPDELLTYFYPDDLARLRAAARSAIELGSEADLDVHLRLPTGEDVWHRGVINVVRDAEGRVVSLRGIVQDITPRKHAELTLRATQLRLAAILEHLPDVVVYEADRSRLFLSDNILSLAGYPAASFQNDRAAFKQLVHPADVRDAWGRIESIFDSRPSEPLVLQYRIRHRDGRYIWVEDRMIFEHPAQGSDRLLGVLIDISERKSSEQRQRLMMAELDHRVKNNIATIISLLEQTARTSRNQEDFHQAFLGRLQALARMHKALSRTHWEGVSLRALVEQTLEAYQSDPPGRVDIRGDDVSLPARAVSPVAMAIHELATNAAKYGALSVIHGRVRVEWFIRQDDPHARSVVLTWIESEGPPVTAPPQPGFGTELIQGGIAYELHGEARIEFPPDGVRCTMTIPLAPPTPAALPLLPDLS